MGKVLLLQHEFEKANGYFDQSLEIASRLGAKSEIMDNYSNLAQSCAATRRFHEADSFMVLYAGVYARMMSDSGSITLKPLIAAKQFKISAIRTGTIFGKRSLLIVLVMLLWIICVAVFSGNSSVKEKG